MGRASRQKRERRELRSARLQPLTHVLAPYTQTSLLRLLDAAVSSPGALYRQPSVKYALFLALTCNEWGNTIADVSSLQVIVDAARATIPELVQIEDWVPLDPRIPVVVRWHDTLLRLHPGAQERPVATIERGQLVAASIDVALVGRFGFGLTDLLDVSLRYTDLAVAALAPTWSASTPLRQDDLVTVSAEEVTAGTPVDIRSITSQCRHPERAAAALAWATCAPDALRFDLTDPTAPMGAVLAVRIAPGNIRALPAGLQLGACASAISRLAAEAVRSQPQCADDFRVRSEARVAELLTRLHRPSIEGPQIAGAGPIHSLIPTSERHALVVGVASGLQQRDVEAQVEVLVDRLERVKPGAAYRFAVGVGAIPADAELTRLLIVSGADHLVVAGPPDMVMMTLDDLEWVAQTADDHDDLYWFCRDLIDARSTTTFAMWETMNKWEWWRRNGKAIHRSGHAPDLIAGAHLTDVEWTSAADNGPIESALLALDLPPYRAWEIVRDEDKWIRLIDRRAGVAWSISQEPRLLGVRYDLGTEPDRVMLHITSVGEALLWILARLAEPFEQIAGAGLGHAPLRVIFRPDDADVDSDPLRLASATPNTITIKWDGRLWNYEEQHPGITQSLLGAAVAQGLVALTPDVLPETVAAFRAAWASAPPALSLSTMASPQHALDLPAPTTAPAPVRAKVRRELASHLSERGIGPGVFAGDAAVRLESTVIYPHLVEALHEAWTGCSLKGLLNVATFQLECATAQRLRQRAELESNVRSLPVEYDPVQQSMEREHTASVLTGALTTIIELALQNPPQGNGKPDKHMWERLLAIAELCADSGRRSESIHYGLVTTVTDISDQYEIERSEGGDQLFDFNAFRQAQVADMLPPIWSLETVSEETSNNAMVVSSPVGLLASHPELTGIDAALRDCLGFGLETLVEVLACLERWPVTSEEPVKEVARGEVIAFCCQDGERPEAEVGAAINALTLRQGNLSTIVIEPWEYSRRLFRLVTQPVIEVGSDNLLILPWWSGQSLRTYILYLGDGRLPWSDSGIDPRLKAALDRYRKTLNDALEDEVAFLITQLGFKARSRVKKARVLNLSTLSGEIDVLAASPTGNTIWVLEVKDPSHAYSIAEMRRAVDRFYEPEKGWVAKLLRKVEDVRADTAGVARSLDVSATELQVRGAMVTRRPVPAAHVPDSPVPFVTVGELSSLLRRAT